MLRLHMMVPLVPNVAQEMVEIQGHIVPKGITWCPYGPCIAMPRYGQSRIGSFSESPVTWLGGRRPFPEYELIPFSAGRHVCLGLLLVMRMLHAMLCSLLHRFEWTLPLEVEENGMDMSENLGLTMTMATLLQSFS
uniref:Cytochrome P450 n=1 Tax=Oryza punctata TaxID=4537 RepID=A0A0E0M6T0_ORYPU